MKKVFLNLNLKLLKIRLWIHFSGYLSGSKSYELLVQTLDDGVTLQDSVLSGFLPMQPYGVLQKVRILVESHVSLNHPI